MVLSQDETAAGRSRGAQRERRKSVIGRTRGQVVRGGHFLDVHKPQMQADSRGPRRRGRTC